jgi:hypothetical protein
MKQFYFVKEEKIRKTDKRRNRKRERHRNGGRERDKEIKWNTWKYLVTEEKGRETSAEEFLSSQTIQID